MFCVCGLLARRREDFECVDDNLGHVALDGISVFPDSCAQFPLDIQAGAFAYVFFGSLCSAVPHDNPVPLGALRNLCARCAGIGALSGGESECRYRPGLDIAYCRVDSDVAE